MLVSILLRGFNINILMSDFDVDAFEVPNGQHVTFGSSSTRVCPDHKRQTARRNPPKYTDDRRAKAGLVKRTRRRYGWSAVCVLCC